jgi:hypothetical protein
MDSTQRVGNRVDRSPADTLLLGSIAAWESGFLGLMREVPVAAFHRLNGICDFGLRDQRRERVSLPDDRPGSIRS